MMDNHWSKGWGSGLYTVSRFTFSSSVCLVSGRQQFVLSGIRMCRFEIRVVYAFPFPSVLLEAFRPVWPANKGKQIRCEYLDMDMVCPM